MLMNGIKSSIWRRSLPITPILQSIESVKATRRPTSISLQKVNLNKQKISDIYFSSKLLVIYAVETCRSRGGWGKGCWKH